MGYLGNKLQGKYHKDTFQTAVNMAWPAIVESFFIAFAGLVDSLMVSSLGSYAVAAVGLTTQPKLLGLAFFFALNVSISALVARRRGEQRQGAANETLVTALVLSLQQLYSVLDLWRLQVRLSICAVQRRRLIMAQ